MDNYTVFFRDNRGWHVTSEYDNPQRALDAQDALRGQNIEAYAVPIRMVVEQVPDHVLSAVLRKAGEVKPTPAL